MVGGARLRGQSCGLAIHAGRTSTMIVTLVNYILQIRDRFRATGDYTDEVFVKVIISFLIAFRLSLEIVNYV